MQFSRGTVPRHPHTESWRLTQLLPPAYVTLQSGLFLGGDFSFTPESYKVGEICLPGHTSLWSFSHLPQTAYAFSPPSKKKEKRKKNPTTQVLRNDLEFIYCFRKFKDLLKPVHGFPSKKLWDFPGGTVAGSPPIKVRRHRFDPWSGRVPQAWSN